MKPEWKELKEYQNIRQLVAKSPEAEDYDASELEIDNVSGILFDICNARVTHNPKIMPRTKEVKRDLEAIRNAANNLSEALNKRLRNPYISEKLPEAYEIALLNQSNDILWTKHTGKGSVDVYVSKVDTKTVDAIQELLFYEKQTKALAEATENLIESGINSSVLPPTGKSGRKDDWINPFIPALYQAINGFVYDTTDDDASYEHEKFAVIAKFLSLIDIDKKPNHLAITYNKSQS